MKGSTVNTSSASLAAVFMQVLLAYLGLMALGVLLGVEAIYAHPTPFYALFMPAMDSLLAPLLIVMFCASILLYFQRQHALSILFVTLCLIAIVLAFVYAEGNFTYFSVSSMLPALLWHLPVFCVLAVFGVVLHKRLTTAQWFEETAESSSPIRARLGLLMIFMIAFVITLALIREGVEAVAAPYQRQAYEYIGDIGKGGSIRGLFAKYTEMHSYLSMHSKVHPPGPVALMWVFSWVTFSAAPIPMAIMTILFGSLSLIPLFLWVRDMANARIAWTTCMIFPLIPSIALFTATSADILFLPFTLTTLFLFWRALHRNSIGYAIAAGIGYACMTLLSFSLIGIGAFFGFVGLWRLRDPEHRMTVVRTAAIMLVAFFAVHGLVWLWSGFDVIECFRLSKQQFDTDQMHLDEITPRYPGWTFKFFNPLCWFYFAGIPVSLLFLRGVFKKHAQGRPLMLVFLFTLLVLNLLYLARGEGERSAMYIMPFLAFPAACALDELGRKQASLVFLSVTLAFLAFQCWLTETLFYTYW